MTTTIQITARGAKSVSMPSAFAERWSIVRSAVSWIENIVERRRRQNAIAELQGLDDRLLRDIGIARCEIWYRVHHPETPTGRRRF